MKIHELYELLRQYDQTWYSRKYIYGDHPQATQIRQFLQAFNDKSDDYEFTHTDLFNLFRIVYTDNGLQLTTSIRNQFDSNYLFEIMKGLNDARLMNLANFTQIYKLDGYERSIVYNLFFSPICETISLNQKKLDAVIALASHHHSTDLIKSFLDLLERKNLLNDTLLKLINDNSRSLSSLLSIFNELEKSGYLNDESLGWLDVVKDLDTSLGFNSNPIGWNPIKLDWLFKCKTIYKLANLLSILNQASIPIDEQLLESICASDNFYSLLEISSLLIQSDKCRLNKDKFHLLLKKDFRFFFEKNPVLVVLNNHELLDEKTFAYVCDNEVSAFKMAVETLLEKSLLSKEIVADLLNKKLDAYYLHRAINYLNKAGLLDQHSLNLCLKSLSIQSQHNIFSKNIVSLFILLDENNFSIKKEYLLILFTLSNANVQRMYMMLSNLIKSNLLSQTSFEQVVKRITLKLPTVLESSMTKNSRKKTQLPRSEIILNNKIRFFTEHENNYERGGFGTVKKGFNSPDTDEPIYGIKKLLISDTNQAKREAIREVKYHHLLGRQAFCFTKSKATIVSEWQREKGLHHFSKSELERESVIKRLQCLCSGLADLNTLHRHYRVHRDVKCQNFILDLKNSSMHLIDFGTAHKKGSFKIFAKTAEYSDPHLFGDHFSNDLYAMGIVAMHLFPEIYTVSFDSGETSIVINKNNFTLQEQIVMKLIDAMMHPDPYIRCNSEDALSYCQEVIKDFNNITSASLKKIALSTILRSNTTVEDVLRDSRRVSF